MLKEHIRFALCRFLGIDLTLSRRMASMERKMTTARELIAQLVQRNRELTSVTDSVQMTLSTTLAALREAQDRIVSDGDISLLQDVINGIDSNIAELSESVRTNTPAENEQQNPPRAPVLPDTPLESEASAGATDANQSAAPESLPVDASPVDQPADAPAANPDPNPPTDR